jgi:hypothetical protein
VTGTGDTCKSREGRREPGAGLHVQSSRHTPEGAYAMSTILLIILILLLVGALPVWPYSGNFGYFPSGGLGLVLLIVIVLLVLGRI